MVADQFDIVRRGVKSLVEAHEYYRVVGEASNGREAMVIASETNPDVAIIDESLPDLNGLELTHQIRRNCPRTEILIYTSRIREDIVLELLRAGVRGVVLKSDPPEHLIAAIDALSIHRPYFSDAISEDSLARFRHSKHADRACCLTPRERHIVQRVAEGLVTRQIANELDISVKTVDTHRANAMYKLNLHSIAHLVRYAIRNNIAQAQSSAAGKCAAVRCPIIGILYLESPITSLPRTRYHSWFSLGSKPMERLPSSGAGHELAHVYCICSFERDAVVPAVEFIDAETDEDAIEVARSKSWLQDLEVWDRHRLVVRIIPTRHQTGL